MILGLGCSCLLALSLAALPRLFLVLSWIWGTKWPLVWQGQWIMPLLGIIFLPYTTIMYMLSYDVLAGGVIGWGWLWVVMGLLLDLMKWGSLYEQRQNAPGYSTYAGGGSAL